MSHQSPPPFLPLPPCPPVISLPVLRANINAKGAAEACGALGQVGFLMLLMVSLEPSPVWTS